MTDLQTYQVIKPAFDRGEAWAIKAMQQLLNRSAVAHVRGLARQALAEKGNAA